MGLFLLLKSLPSERSERFGASREGRSKRSRGSIPALSRTRSGFKDAAGVTPADFLGNLNNFLDDEDSADADILRRMVVKACVNVREPEVLNDSLIEIRDLLSRFIVYREDDPSNISSRLCPACATAVPRGFCYCAARNCELRSSSSMSMTRNQGIRHQQDEGRRWAN